MQNEQGRRLASSNAAPHGPAIRRVVLSRAGTEAGPYTGSPLRPFGAPPPQEGRL